MKTMKLNKTLLLAVLAITATITTALGQVPGIIQYQGRVTSHGTNFSGKGGFKFAIIENVITGDSVWSNDGTSDLGSEPTKSVSVDVQDGLFIMGLGDQSLGNMMTIPASIFTYQSLQLRIWFDDGVSGFVALSPDQPITSVGFAMMAATVSDGAITAGKLAPNAVTGDKIANDAVAGLHLLNRTISGSKIVSNSVSSTEIADALTLHQLDLGSSLAHGTLNLWASGVNESRGLLAGDGLGSLLNLKFSTSNTGAVLSARSPGGKLNLWNLSGDEGVLLSAGSTGGELSLFQGNGQVGLFLDAQGTGNGGLVRVMDSTGTVATAEIVGAETSNTGAELRLRRANGIETMIFDAEYEGDGSPRVDFFRGDGLSTMVFLPGGGDATLGGGGLMRVGDFDGNNLGIDGDEIIARTNGAAGPLRLNYGYTAPVVMSRVAINTLTPAAGYELSVDGQIICEELVVQNSAEWPDYVFADDYQLMPLEEVEASIQKNKHLPGIPSAKKIGADGIPLGQIQKQMMEKIEELTLHLIQQNKRLQAQEEELGKLRARLSVAK